MCENVLLTYISLYHLCARFLLGFRLELWMIVCHHVGVRNWILVLCKNKCS